MNMVKLPSFRFEQCLHAFTMLLVKGYLETALFKHLPDLVFRSCYFRKYISYECHLFFKNVQNLIQDLKPCKKNREKAFFS